MSELDRGSAGSEEKNGDGGSRERRGVAFHIEAGASVRAFSGLGDDESVTRRLLSLVIRLGVRDNVCGVNACLTGEVFNRRLAELGGNVSMAEVDTVRLRWSDGRR